MRGPHPGTQELTHSTAQHPGKPAPQAVRQDTPYVPSAGKKPFKEVNGIVFTA